MNKYAVGGFAALGGIAAIWIASDVKYYRRSKEFLIKEHAEYLAIHPGDAKNRQLTASMMRSEPFGEGIGADIAVRRFQRGEFDSEIEAKVAELKNRK